VKRRRPGGAAASLFRPLVRTDEVGRA